ncbi:hypothetical protein E0Z10_g5098 [Xylaria hypoxylon]|uniref:RRM domain-containing protein n=1 Tax=Xylaria hypoxylon TaxID=37992 RepID=A0A4Z0Z230_9PEZI|nr:hypothetical protein E0Z10_g5098 [Xylaria hypoxylon]
MNQIRAIQALNKREIENGVSPEASWHTDYRDTAFINFGGLPYELTEGDIITIFSQYGEPVFLKLARDKESGKSKGFGWLKYEDQRSCDLAVDNLGGAEIAGRLVRVDHARYKARDDEDPEEFAIGWADVMRKEKGAKGEALETEDEDEGEEQEARRPMIKEEMELQKLIEEHDDDDPMKGFLIEEKKREVNEALRKEKDRKDRKDKKHRHHRSHHRAQKDESNDRRNRRSRRDTTPVIENGKSRDRDVTPQRKDRSRDRDRETRTHGDERRHDGDRHRDRESRGRGHQRGEDSADRRTRRHEDEGRDRDRDRDGHHKRRRRSRTRSPRT